MTWLCLLLSVAVAQSVRDSSTVQLAAFGGRVEVCTVHSCGCPPGFAGAACVACPAGSFKGGHGAGGCEQCPANSLSLPASTSREECLCAPGHLADGSGCAPCAGGAYKPYYGRGPCTLCPPGAGSESGAAELTECQCALGFVGEAVGGCTACAAGKYKPGPGALACEDCPVNSFGESDCTVIPFQQCVLWKEEYLDTINRALGASSTIPPAPVVGTQTETLRTFLAYYIWMVNEPAYSAVHFGDCAALGRAVWARLGYPAAFDPSQPGTMPSATLHFNELPSEAESFNELQGAAAYFNVPRRGAASSVQPVHTLLALASVGALACTLQP